MLAFMGKMMTTNLPAYQVGSKTWQLATRIHVIRGEV